MLLAFSTLQQRLRHADVPAIWRDAPIALLSAGLMALALLGFTGLVRE
jgi:electron transport complex protein RnfA